jgi:transposase
MRKDKTTFGIIDAQSVQNADIAEEKGNDAGALAPSLSFPIGKRPERTYDAGKKVSGIKRHIVVASQSLPHAVTTANITDREGAPRMITENAATLSRVEKYLVDGGYSGERFAEAVKTLCGAEVEVIKRNELHTFVILPRRWVVERSFGWLDKSRRLWKNCERKIHNSLQMSVSEFLCKCQNINRTKLVLYQTQ